MISKNEEDLQEKLQLYKTLLQSDSFANVSSLLKDGSPHVTPVWFDYDEENYLIKITAFEHSQKDKNFIRDNRVALTVIDRNNPYCYLQIQGQVVSREFDNQSQMADYLTKKYSKGKQLKYPQSGKNIMIYGIKPLKVTGWNPTSAEIFNNWMNGAV